MNVIIALFLLATLRGYRKYYYYMSIQLNIISIYFLKILQFKYNLLVVTIKQRYIKRSKLKVVLKSSQSQAQICNISLNRLTNVDLCLQLMDILRTGVNGARVVKLVVLGSRPGHVYVYLLGMAERLVAAIIQRKTNAW